MKLYLQRQWPNTEAFETGINVFDKEEQGKLQVRAERFGINPDESQASNNIEELHDSLGITSENEKNIRFEAIHMNGTDQMIAQDVFVYFEIFAPSSIEWVSDTSCNVVWNDKISAARALLRLSEPIRGMPVEDPGNLFTDTIEDEEGTSTGRSILLLGKDRDVQMKDKDKENGNAGTMHVSDIKVPVPPGYWRLGKPCAKSRFILLRFAQRTDKKPFKVERFSQNYKKYGNPNFGSLKGIISESKKKQMKGIFDRHDGIIQNLEEKEPVSGNPWGSLAKNWNKDHRQEKTSLEFPADPLVSSTALKSSGILKRLGHKRAAAATPPSSGSDSESEKPESKKSKVPRMRMYADEEEEKIRRRKALKLLGKIQEQTTQAPEKPDLRRKLNQAEPRLRAAKMPDIKVEPELDLRDMRNRIPRREMVNFRVQKLVQREYSEPEEDEEVSEQDLEEDSDENPQQTQKQKSKVMVIIKKQRQPTVASTVWSRMNNAKQKKTLQISDDEEEDEAMEDDVNKSSSDSDEDLVANRAKLKAAVQRPGFSSGSLKSRLGVKPTEHKSPLRIEINNDLFKSKTAK